MTTRSYEIFLAVCTKMNMSRAAESLFITQAAVSHSITAMEEFYGVKLFERKSSKLYLTPAGEYLKENIERIMDELDDIRVGIKSESTKRKKVRLGCTLTPGEYFIHDFLDFFYSQHSNIDVFLGSYAAHTAEEMLMRDELDLVITENPMSTQLLDCAEIFSDEVLFIAKKGSKHIDVPSNASGRIPVLEKSVLEGLPIFIQVWDSSSQNIAELALKSQGFGLKYVGHLNSFEEIKKAVKHDFGIGTISTMALENDPDIRPFKIKGVDSRRSISMAMRKHGETPPELLSLMDTLMTYVTLFAARSRYITLPGGYHSL